MGATMGSGTASSESYVNALLLRVIGVALWRLLLKIVFLVN